MLLVNGVNLGEIYSNNYMLRKTQGHVSVCVYVCEGGREGRWSSCIRQDFFYILFKFLLIISNIKFESVNFELN